MEIKELIKIAESNSWTVTEEEYTNGKGLLFSRYSPAGKTFQYQPDHLKVRKN